MPVERLQALADPLRWAITDTLRAGPRCACELVDDLDIPAPLLSHHMKVLRRAELVRARKLGRRVEYTLDLAALDELAQAIGCQVGPSVAAGVAHQ
jgi:ArsR family transcriptional regulator, arsenate/arsenite/antimonite-responsive transcriptional repressor